MRFSGPGHDFRHAHETGYAVVGRQVFAFLHGTVAVPFQGTDPVPAACLVHIGHDADAVRGGAVVKIKEHIIAGRGNVLAAGIHIQAAQAVLQVRDIAFARQVRFGNLRIGSAEGDEHRAPVSVGIAVPAAVTRVAAGNAVVADHEIARALPVPALRFGNRYNILRVILSRRKVAERFLPVAALFRFRNGHGGGRRRGNRFAGRVGYGHRKRVRTEGRGHIADRSLIPFAVPDGSAVARDIVGDGIGKRASLRGGFKYKFFFVGHGVAHAGNDPRGKGFPHDGHGGSGDGGLPALVPRRKRQGIYAAIQGFPADFPFAGERTGSLRRARPVRNGIADRACVGNGKAPYDLIIHGYSVRIRRERGNRGFRRGFLYGRFNRFSRGSLGRFLRRHFGGFRRGRFDRFGRGSPGRFLRRHFSGFQRGRFGRFGRGGFGRVRRGRFGGFRRGRFGRGGLRGVLRRGFSGLYDFPVSAFRVRRGKVDRHANLQRNHAQHKRQNAYEADGFSGKQPPSAAFRVRLWSS